MEKESPYVLGEVTSYGVEVMDIECGVCECCLRDVWCGGSNVCFECRTNDCESVHSDLIADGS